MIVLGDGEGQATISPTGAELRTWRVGDTDLLWPGDPATWPDTAPLLFPVVGWTRNAAVTVAGRRYPLGLHGFARHCRFEAVQLTATTAVLRAKADAATRAMYPFDWTLELHVAVSGPSLAVMLVVTNTGHGPMPYACGLHPGFRWPFDGGKPEACRIEFEAAEHECVPVIDNHGLFTRDRRPIPLQDGRVLPLTPALFAAEALCFIDARSSAVRFVRQDGAAIDCSHEGFRHIALWSRPPGRFLCIEAWTGRGDDADADGNLFAKPSMTVLAPGEQGTHAARYRFKPADAPT